MIQKILCWFNKHRWSFVRGKWIVQNDYALTTRRCLGCKLEQDIGQDHILGVQDLWEERK